LPKQTPQKDHVHARSPISKGLAGRLVAEFEDLKLGVRFAIYLELRNHSSDPIAVTNQPQIAAEVFDEAGNVVSPSGARRSGPLRSPQWVVIPIDAYVGYRVDMQTLGLSEKERHVVLLAVGDNSWELKVGKYVFKATASFEESKDGPQDQWIGELVLPPVEIVVTHEMFQQ